MNVSLMVTTAMAVAAESPEIRTVHSQASVMLRTGEVELAVTLRGGHMAPVTFFRDTPVPVRPYHVSPWQDEGESKMPAPVLVTL